MPALEHAHADDLGPDPVTALIATFAIAHVAYESYKRGDRR